MNILMIGKHNSEARIYQPTKTAMQSGRAKSHSWLLEFESTEARRADPLMGWISSGDTSSQVRLFFTSKADAIAYAEREGINFHVAEPKRRKIKAKSYTDNFSSRFRFK